MGDDIQKTILRIYDAVADDSLWSEVLDRFVHRIDAQGSIIFEWEEDADQKRLTAPFHSRFYTADGLAMYLEKCWQLEAQDQAVVRQHTKDNDSIDLIDDTVLAKSTKALLQQAHVQRLQKFGIFRRAAGVLNKDNPWISLFSVQFESDRQPLNKADRLYMAQLLPHFAKAHDLSLPMRQVKKESQSVLAAIDQLTIGICVLDPNGNIIIRNEEFRRQQDSYRTFLTTKEGALQIAGEQDQKRFEALKADVRRHGEFGARPRKEAISTVADNFLCIEITPLNKSDEMGSNVFGGFIVYSTDTSLPVRCNTTPIKQAFGLTDAELTLVDGISEGQTNPEIADHHGKSVSTVNAQVKSILSKSQCATRTQFVRMMMRFGGSFVSTDK